MTANVRVKQEKNSTGCWVKMNSEKQLFSSLLTNRYERENKKDNYNNVSAIHASAFFDSKLVLTKYCRKASEGLWSLNMSRFVTKRDNFCQ